MANNVQNVKFLRNGSLYATRDAAIEGMNTQLTSNSLADGSAILGRYGSGNDIKTLVGYVYNDGSTKTLTIFDIEGASGDVNELRTEINNKLGNGITSANTATAQLAALSGNSSTDTSATTSVEGAKKYAKEYTDTELGKLDYTDTAEPGSYVSEVQQLDGKITATTKVALPTVAAISETGKPITAVSETLGEIAASAGTINAQYVDVTGFTANNVQGVLEEIDGAYKAAISGLDYTDTAVTGSYVSKVDEVDGVISVTRVALPSSADTAVAKKFVTAVAEDKGQITVSRGEITSSDKTIVLGDGADGGIDLKANVDGTTIVVDNNTGVMSVANSALIQYVGDEKTIEISAADANNKKTVSSLLTLSSVTPSSTTVKEEYALKNASGETIGSTIKIYKDSSVVSIEYITDSSDAHYQNLKYTYIDVSGNTQTEYVDISSLVLEAEFQSGVTVTDHIAHGVVDPASESFLTVGADGFKLSGVQTAINNAVSAAVETLDATVSGETSDGKVNVKVTEADGKITAVDVVGTDIASAQDLSDETTARTAADTELSNRLGADVTTANTASAQLAALSGNSSTDTSATTSVAGAKKYADAILADAVEGLDANVTGNSTHVTVGVSEANGKITAVTVTEDNIASASDLTELSGKTVTAITSTNSSITASINDAVGNKTYNIETDASKIKMSGFSSNSIFSGITSSSSITEAFGEVEDVIEENERVTSTALNDLDGRLDAIESGYVETVKVNNVDLTETNNSVNVQIAGSTTAATATSTEAIVVTTDSTTGAITLGIATIDCGTY